MAKALPSNSLKSMSVRSRRGTWVGSLACCCFPMMGLRRKFSAMTARGEKRTRHEKRETGMPNFVEMDLGSEFPQ